MDASNPITFYDIASGPPVTCFAPNPWKTRYALNFKGVHYRTEWVELPDVTSVRKRLAVAPNRKHADGSDFYTLPIIHDPTAGETIGDSFDIALYLDKTYPDRPTLCPPSTVGLHAAFNVQVDAIFTQFALLFSHGLPFNPANEAVCKANFEARLGVKWEQLTVRGEKREKLLEDLKMALGGLAKYYRCDDGPFLEGAKTSYADLIVGAWLMFYKIIVPEWVDIQSWHGGRWGKIHEALQKYAAVV